MRKAPEGIAERRARWARFQVWEASWRGRTAQLEGEEAIRAVGEIVEFYLEMSGGSASAGQSITEKVEAIRRLHHALRMVRAR